MRFYYILLLTWAKLEVSLEKLVYITNLTPAWDKHQYGSILKHKHSNTWTWTNTSMAPSLNTGTQKHEYEQTLVWHRP